MRSSWADSHRHACNGYRRPGLRIGCFGAYASRESNMATCTRWPGGVPRQQSASPRSSLTRHGKILESRSFTSCCTPTRHIGEPRPCTTGAISSAPGFGFAGQGTRDRLRAETDTGAQQPASITRSISILPSARSAVGRLSSASWRDLGRGRDRSHHRAECDCPLCRRYGPAESQKYVVGVGAVARRLVRVKSGGYRRWTVRPDVVGPVRPM